MNEAKKQDIGLIGTGVMGSALALNIASKGYYLGIYNRTHSKSLLVEEEAKKNSFHVCAYDKLDEFIDSLIIPRKIIMIVTYGAATDDLIQKIIKYLTPGDIIIDAANEHYTNTTRRADELKKIGINYLGMGISGGEYGARYGPSLMPGGDFSAFYSVKSILEDIAAKTHDDVCVKYMGRGGAGHYVKMVHNGVEYGIMQLICETYDILRKVFKYSNEEIANIFKQFQTGRLNSYLVEITYDILLTKDPNNENAYVIDQILDVAGAKGTGKWTALESFQIRVPCPSICSAVDYRNISVDKKQRTENYEHYNNLCLNTAIPSSNPITIEDIENALYACHVITFIQGLSLIQQASEIYEFNINLVDVITVWQNGCILRGDILKVMSACLSEKNLLVNENVKTILTNAYNSWQKVVYFATMTSVSVPVYSSSLNYFTAYIDNNNPTSLLQAQRDYFGAHTFYLMDDLTKSRHFDWINKKWL